MLVKANLRQERLAPAASPKLRAPHRADAAPLAPVLNRGYETPVLANLVLPVPHVAAEGFVSTLINLGRSRSIRPRRSFERGGTSMGLARRRICVPMGGIGLGPGIFCKRP